MEKTEFCNVWAKVTLPFRIQPLRGIVFMTRSRWQCSHHLQDHATFARTPHICQIHKICWIGFGVGKNIQRINSSWWFFTNPCEKYARQIGSFPQIEMNIKKMFEFPPPGIDLDWFFLDKKLISEEKYQIQNLELSKGWVYRRWKTQGRSGEKKSFPGCRSPSPGDGDFFGFVLAMNVKSTWKKP